MSKPQLSPEVLDQLKDFMLTSMDQAHLNPSGRELTCRCPFCGDSSSNRAKTSFSLNVDPDSEHFLRYQCFRASCGIKGVANDEFYEAIGFTRTDVIKNINAYLASKMVKIGGVYRSKKKKELINIVNTKNDVAQKKLDYINHRLGLDLTFDDLYKFKINLDLNELLRINEIKPPEGKGHYYRLLSDYGVSFISAYNDYVIIRDISKSQKIGKRYTNINIFNNYENVTKCYCIPRSIDLIDPSPCVINITEGAFDIIGVYHHTNIDRQYRNQLYLAACGCGIVNIIKAYIQQYGLINVKINIFSDADVPIEKYEELKKLKPYLTKFDVTIYYNTLEKDFGVSKDRIKFIKSKL